MAYAPDLATIDTTSCDREPIHVPGSIQPHGCMLIADAELRVVGHAGLSGHDDGDLVGQPLPDVLVGRLPLTPESVPTNGTRVLGAMTFRGEIRDAVAFRTGEYVVVELTGRDDDPELDASFLAEIEAVGGSLDRANSFSELFDEAARTFQHLTGYDRVMIYQFVDDEAGVVVGEALSDSTASFMNHHFPASDIPRQARALYVRNRVRVIADVHYEPAPIVGAPELRQIDLSDSTLRSVSPVHIQYLKNMGVEASASMSIVKDGILWGLVACHHHSPRPLCLTTRLASQTLASSLARQVKAREDSDLYRERLRLRSHEDIVLRRLGGDQTLERFFDGSGEDLARLMRADGFAAVQGGEVYCAGSCPSAEDIREIASFVKAPGALKPFANASLARDLPNARAYADVASGLLAITMSTEVPTILMWFRAEYLQVVQWAGNPHKDVPATPGETLRPRASFEAWSESVRGRSRPWTIGETEAATRIVRLLLEARTNSRLERLNEELATTIRENESLLRQKDFLLKEVNHRVQNSLGLVSAFLRLQRREASAETAAHLIEAEKRLNAVGLVHKRLHQDDSVEVVDLSRYFEELGGELFGSLGEAWERQITQDYAPVLVTTDRAVSLGLILNELATNAIKYAYASEAGPLGIHLMEHRDRLRLTISDKGVGRSGSVKGTGFGTRMLAALVERLDGTLEYEDNRPGVRAVLTAPIQATL